VEPKFEVQEGRTSAVYAVYESSSTVVTVCYTPVVRGISQNGNRVRRMDSQAGVLSILLSVLGSEQEVFDRQYRLDRLSLRNVSGLK